VIACAAVVFADHMHGYGSGDEQECNNDDYKRIYTLMSDVQNLPQGWFVGCNVCEWTGVLCNNEGYVKGIQLHSYGLHGTLDLSDGLPYHINMIELHLNALYGTLNCSTLKHTTYRLQYMHFHTNSFTHVISCDRESLPDTVIQFDATINGELYCPINYDYDNLKGAFHDTSNIPLDWFQACNYCVWTGVSCEYTKVTSIDLQNVTGSMDLSQLNGKQIDMNINIERDFE
jgi:hypothetical protein